MNPAYALAALLLAIFVLVGALDLGVGLLLPFVARGRDRDAVLASGGRPWSAGAVWTLVAFALLVAGLPASLGALRALWPPLVLMLAALTLRGVATALRPHPPRQGLCDLALGLASLAAAGCQGLLIGWFVGGLGTGLPTRHFGPLGPFSIWGLLCAAGLVGLDGLLGAGWLILSGRGAVRVFGREVGHAAALLSAGAAMLCWLWALPTGVVGRAMENGWGQAAAPAALGLVTLAALVPFWLSLWGGRPAAPLACAALSALCGFAAVAVLPWPVPMPDVAAEGSSSAYLAFVLLLGSPLAVADPLRRLSVLRAGTGPERIETRPHAGRRSGSLANSLHLS